MLNLQKYNYFLSFYSPIFHSKTHKHPVTFFQRVWGKSPKQTYVEDGEGGCKMNRDEQEREGVKN